MWAATIADYLRLAPPQAVPGHRCSDSSRHLSDKMMCHQVSRVMLIIRFSVNRATTP